jgi:hypothetical protein
MEYLLFIISDPAAPRYVPEEDNIEEWVGDLESRGVARGGNPRRPPRNACRSCRRSSGSAGTGISRRTASRMPWPAH